MGKNPHAPTYLARFMSRFLQTVNVRHREACPMCGKPLVNLCTVPTMVAGCAIGAF